MNGPVQMGMFRSRVKSFWGLQVGGIVHHTGRHGHVRHGRMNAYRVLVDDIDTRNGVHCATVPFGADGRVFDAQDIELHGFCVDLAAVVKQDAFAQPEQPRGEFLVETQESGVRMLTA